MMEDQRDARVENLKAFADLDKKVDLHIQKTESDLKLIHEQDMVQNNLLDTHIAGVNTLRSIHEEHVKENNTRFSKLEEPRKFINTLRKLVIWLGGIGAAFTGIMEAISWFKGH